MPMKRDWRTDYVICEHVERDEAAGTRHRGFRACCDDCWKGGFLTAEPLSVEERGDFAIGRMQEGGAR